MDKQEHIEANQQQSLSEDLTLQETAAENVKGGPQSCNNLKQIGLAIHSLAE